MLQNSIPLKVMWAKTKNYNNVEEMTHSRKSCTKIFSWIFSENGILYPEKKKKRNLGHYLESISIFKTISLDADNENV